MSIQTQQLNFATVSNSGVSTKNLNRKVKPKYVIEFDIVDPEFHFNDDVWIIIKNFVGFFTRPQIVPRWTARDILCLEVHWNCKQCEKSIKTQHDVAWPHRRIRSLLNEITKDPLCLSCCKIRRDRIHDEWVVWVLAKEKAELALRLAVEAPAMEDIIEALSDAIGKTNFHRIVSYLERCHRQITRRVLLL
jgi:hypothetical protein